MNFHHTLKCEKLLKTLISSALFILFTNLCTKAFADNGAQHYLPVTMSPEIEARIETLFVLANIPIIKRPIPINAVKEAISHASYEYPVISRSVARYIERYEKDIGLTHFSVSARISEGSSQKRANARGETSESNYAFSQRSFVSLGDHFIFNTGANLYDGNNGQKDRFADGTYLSLGWDTFQVDIGYRDHWYGPFSDSDMLLTTNAPSIPSITISNSKPLNLWNMQYEVFFGEMSESDRIESGTNPAEDVTGKPKLMGVHLSFIPLSGFAIGFNRLLQFGGGNRDESISSLTKAFFQVKASENIGFEGNDFGNQLSSITTKYTFNDRFPLSVYMEYAGEDTSKPSNFHLGNSSLMLGFHLPMLTNNIGLTYEFADWQNLWYVNGNYGDGLTNYQSILGHWGGEQRAFGDAVPATSHMAKLLWQVGNGKTLSTIYRSLDNRDPAQRIDYVTSRTLELEYSHALKKHIIGINIFAGNDVFDDSFTQISGFIRW